MNPSPPDGNAGSSDVQDVGDVTAVTQTSGKPRPRVDSAGPPAIAGVETRPRSSSRGNLLRHRAVRPAMGSRVVPQGSVLRDNPGTRRRLSSPAHARAGGRSPVTIGLA